MTMMTNTNTNALMAANQQAHQIPFYSEIMTNSPAEKQGFEIGNGIFFEYSSADEWEVTLENSEIDIDEFMRVANQTVRLIGCLERENKDCLRMYLVAKMMFERFL